MLSFLAGPLGTKSPAAPPQPCVAEQSCRAQPGLMSNLSHSFPRVVSGLSKLLPGGSQLRQAATESVTEDSRPLHLLPLTCQDTQVASSGVYPASWTRGGGDGILEGTYPGLSYVFTSEFVLWLTKAYQLPCRMTLLGVCPLCIIKAIKARPHCSKGMVMVSQKANTVGG